MAKLDPPQLRSGPLSNSVLCITHGKFEGDYLEASRKYDVTDQFDALARERGWTPPAASTQPPSPQAECTCHKEVHHEIAGSPMEIFRVPDCPVHGSPQAEVQDCEKVVRSGRTDAGAEYRAHFTGDPDPEAVEAVETLVEAVHAKISAEAEGRCGGSGELWTQPPPGHIGSMKRPCPGCPDFNGTGKQSPAEPQGDVVEALARALGWDLEEPEAEPGEVRRNVEKILAAITPLFPGSSYVRERLEAVTAAAKEVVEWSDREQEYVEKAPQGWEAAEATKLFREARGRLRTALAALDTPVPSEPRNDIHAVGEEQVSSSPIISSTDSEGQE